MAKSKTKLRHAPHVLKPYAFDPRTTVGPGPAKQIVVLGFDPFTPESQLKAFFSSYGEIAELKNQTDPATGSFLGICLVKYRDSRPGRGQPVSAANAAKRAEKEGNNERIGVRHIKIERDREGRKCKRHVESVLKRARDQLERERARHAPRAVSVPKPPPPATQSPPAESPAPPPNAPRGPAGKSAAKPPEGPKSGSSQSPAVSTIEPEPVLSKIKRMPYLFISHEHVPVLGTTIPHLKKRLRTFDWRDVRLDKTGYYVIFEESKRGEDETVRCFKECNNGPLFTYKMAMQCQQYGNPEYERSPSPETQASELKKREEMERLRKEEEEDLQEEKRQRAIYLDPVKGALEQLQTDLRNKLMDDIKSRITIPTLYDYLDPARHAAKRRKLDLPDPNDNENKVPALLINKAAETPGTSKGGRGQRARPLRPHDPNSQRGRRETTNAYVDERRKRPPPRPTHARPLHFRLQQMFGGDDEDSDDERRTSITRDTEEQESRPLSRASRTSTPFGDSESVADSTTPKKKRKMEHKAAAWEPPEEEEEEFEPCHKQLLGDVLRKQPEGMATRELELVISTLPRESAFHKRCKTEYFIRQRSKYDDDLFKTRGEEAANTPTPVTETAANNDAAKDPSSLDVGKASEVKPVKKDNKRKRKSKKQIFEEREALKKAAKAVADSQFIEQDAIEEIEEKEKELDEAEEITDDLVTPQVEWAVSTDKPRRTVEDDPDLVLDIDGWQDIVKDNEDLECLKRALQDETPAELGDVAIWAWKQKEIKALNTGLFGPVHEEAARIHGYYVPNFTGSARTEGIKKIRESEKSKYLPHRIKVQRAREEREAQAREDPIAAAAAAVDKAKEEAAARLAATAASRMNRANNRRLVNDINLQKQNLAVAGAEADAIRFNQLKKRKKLVKFDRSAIHGWGLYAMENISFNDMIIEYVGEKVRQKVADLREIKYTKQGIGSSYLFRMVDDEIVDATKKGGIARFINHSCTPNCTARIIKVEGTRRIVIYALKDIAKSE